MRLITYLHDGIRSLGVVEENLVIPISRPLKGIADDMISLISNWDRAAPIVREAIATAQDALPLAEVRLLAPIPRPGKIMCIGLNYEDHLAEFEVPAPEFQTWFCKMPNAVNGPFDPLPLPIASAALDYEAELVVVIGKGGKHITRERASEHVFGYCVGNDASIRDWQLRTSQFVLGKSFDGMAPFGPWITTSDSVGDPHRLDISCHVNGEQRQNSNTSHLIFGIWEMIEHLSQAMTLEPGDIIFTGSPAGVGWSMKPPRALVAGDKVQCAIEGLGAILSTVEHETV